MTEEETKIAEAFKVCADVRLPADFADRLVARIREGDAAEGNGKSPKAAFARIALVAASATLLLGFFPNVWDATPGRSAEIVAHADEIRPADRTPPKDGQLNALAFLGFCREAVRRRVRSLLDRGRKREDEQ